MHLASTYAFDPHGKEEETPLSRGGRRFAPPRDGRYLQAVGYYSPVVKDPETGKSTVQIDPERARDWLRKGAQPTDRVRKLLKIVGVLDEHDRITASPDPAAAAATAAE